MFLENAENNGTVDVVAIKELATELDLGDDELAVVRTELEARGVGDHELRREMTTSSSSTSSPERRQALTRSGSS